MARFTIGDFDFDIIGHEQVKADGSIRERFTVDLYYQGKPLSWHPNQKGADDFPGIPNRQVIEWVGKEVVDVYDEKGEKVGAKRGADFRGRFWPMLIHRADKVQIAEASGRRVGDVLDDEVTWFEWVGKEPPVDLVAKSRDAEGKVTEERSLEEAVAVLTAIQDVKH